MTARRFVYISDEHSKWWEIEIVGIDVITRYGRIGNAGQETIKSFNSEEQAKLAADKLVSSKLKKGYISE